MHELLESTRMNAHGSRINQAALRKLWRETAKELHGSLTLKGFADSGGHMNRKYGYVKDASDMRSSSLIKEPLREGSYFMP